MRTIFELADWFLAKEKMQHKKLQKLCYYAVAWGYAILPEPICDAPFEAWPHGPVNPDLYRKYKPYGFGWIPQNDTPPQFSEQEIDFMESAWLTYGDHTANSLEALSHSEMPWQKARAGLAGNEPSNRVISTEDMRDFYRSIYSGGEA